MILRPFLCKQNTGIRFWNLEFLIVLCTIFLITGSLDCLLFPVTEDSASQLGSAFSALRGDTGTMNPIRQILLTPLYLYAVIFLFRNFHKTIATLFQTWPLSLLLCLSVVSVVWSIDVDATFRRSLNLVFSSLFAIFLAIRYSPEEFCRVIGRCFLLICICTIFAVICFPSIGIHGGSHYPAIRGFFPHKNTLGATMVAAVLMGRVLMSSSEDRRLGRWLFLLSTTLVVFSLSRTAWLNTGIVLTLFWGMLRLHKHKTILYLLLCIVFLAGFACVELIGTDTLITETTSLLGRSADFTGRASFWPTLIDAVSRDHFWLGFGYQAFWTSAKGAFSIMWSTDGFVPMHAHNGWLQVYSHLGIVGVFLMALAVIKSFRLNFNTAMPETNVYLSYGPIFLVFFLTENMTEAFMMTRDNMLWVFFIYFSALKIPSALQHKKKSLGLLTQRNQPEQDGVPHHE